MPRGQRGDGEDGHIAFQGTGSDAVTVRHCSLPAKEPAARSQHRPATLSKVTPPGDCRAGEPVAFGGLRWGHSCIPDRSSPGHAPAASPSPAPPSARHGAGCNGESHRDEGGVGNKWVNQTNHRKSGSDLGWFPPVSVQRSSSVPAAFAAFTTALKRAAAEPLNISILLHKHPLSQTLWLHLQ